MATGTTLPKEDLAWLIKDTVKCLPTVGVSLVALVDTAGATRCKAAMVGLQVLVDILLTVKPATTAATRVNKLTNSDTIVQIGGPL